MPSTSQDVYDTIVCSVWNRDRHQYHSTNQYLWTIGKAEAPMQSSSEDSQYDLHVFYDIFIWMITCTGNGDPSFML